jgi:hypothetical protein
MNTKMNIKIVILSAIPLIIPTIHFKVPVNAQLNPTDIPKCEDVALTDYAGLRLSNSGYALPLCSIMEDLGKNVGCWDHEDYPDLPQEGGCQQEDDYCDHDENCQKITVDCINDRNFEDDYNG